MLIARSSLLVEEKDIRNNQTKSPAACIALLWTVVFHAHSAFLSLIQGWSFFRPRERIALQGIGK